MRYSRNMSQDSNGGTDQEETTVRCRHTTKLKLNIRSKAVHDWIEPIITSVFVNQFAEHVGTGAAIESSPLRFPKRLDSGRIVTIHEHNVDDVTILI